MSVMIITTPERLLELENDPEYERVEIDWSRLKRKRSGEFLEGAGELLAFYFTVVVLVEHQQEMRKLKRKATQGRRKRKR